MAFSIDLRERVIAAIDSGMQITEAAKVFKVCRSVIYDWQNLFKKTRSLAPKSGYQKGHSHKITDWNQFKIFAENHKYCTSSQMKVEWKKFTNIDVSESVMLRSLKKIGYTSKKKLLIMQKQIKKIDPANIVYSDETGIDDNETLLTGWAPRGKRCHAQKKAYRKSRYNITAALNLNVLLAPFLFEGYSNTVVYETYIKQVLIPALKPGMVVVIDNASFHKSRKIVELIHAANCRIIFLPPYSPDFNPIEHHWAAVKSAIRKAAEKVKDFYVAAVQTLEKMCGA